MDLSINSTTSLSPVSKDFNPKRFVEEIQNKKSELRDTLVDWKIAIETHNEWFPEEAISMPKELAEVWGLGITLVEDDEEKRGNRRRIKEKIRKKGQFNRCPFLLGL